MAVRQPVSGKNITATGQITTAGKSGILYSVVVSSAGVGDAVATFSDGSGGTTLLVIKSGTSSDSASITFVNGIIFSSDIYCTITGTATVNVSVEYDEIES